MRAIYSRAVATASAIARIPTTPAAPQATVTAASPAPFTTLRVRDQARLTAPPP